MSAVVLGADDDNTATCPDCGDDYDPSGPCPRCDEIDLPTDEEIEAMADHYEKREAA